MRALLNLTLKSDCGPTKLLQCISTIILIHLHFQPLEAVSRCRDRLI